MALIVRIDVDRPYGKQGFLRHVASRLSSDYILPRMEWMRYLHELKTILGILNERNQAAFVFFRRCTYPTREAMELMEAGGHQFGLHLEDSRCAASFLEERKALEERLGRPVYAFSKHGSGRARLGRHHYAPYEFDRYIEWGTMAGMKFLFGNLEDPRLSPSHSGELLCFPSAFWLEPQWRDSKAFPIEWLLREARRRDVVLLLHPDNVTSDGDIMREFKLLVGSLETTVCPEDAGESAISFSG